MALGKWIFGALGFVVAGPIGGIVALLIGSLYENGSQYVQANSTQRTTQGDLRVSIIVLFACVIKADGKVLKSEINYVKPFLVRNFGEEGAKQALALLKELLKQDIDVVAVSKQIAQIGRAHV